MDKRKKQEERETGEEMKGKKGRKKEPERSVKQKKRKEKDRIRMEMKEGRRIFQLGNLQQMEEGRNRRGQILLRKEM